MMNLPAKEELERSTVTIAEMYALFFSTLIKERISSDAALEMTLVYMECVQRGASSSQGEVSQEGE